MVNAQEIKEKLLSMNKEWGNQKQLEWIERICDKFNVENMQHTLSIHANNDYLLNNNEYRKNMAKKVNLSPTF